MQFRKKILCSMERCYAASTISVGGEVAAVLASEAEGGPCYAFRGSDFDEKEIIWESAGGTMSLLPIPGRDAEFIAVQRFFPGFKSEAAKLVWGKREGGGWVVKDLAALPFVHRFDLFEIEGEVQILAATLCGSKKDREDWSDPGSVWVAKLPERAEEGLAFRQIMQGLVKNHGYCRAVYEGRSCAFITHEGGIEVLVPPQQAGGEWSSAHIFDGAVGDVAFVDFDGDGVAELVTIEPFHGSAFVVRKLGEDGYEEVYRYDGDVNFGHAVLAAEICGEPVALCGARRGESSLFILRRGDGESFCRAEIVESGIGPSNVAVINAPGRDVIIAANHSANEAALYFVGGEECLMN